MMNLDLDTNAPAKLWSGHWQRTLGIVLMLVGGMVSGSAPARADANDSAAKASAPEYLTPSLTLRAVQATYHLDDAVGLISRLEAARRSEGDERAAYAAGKAPDPKAHVEYPEPPAVKLLLTVKNASKRFVRMWNLDDRSTLTISLQGAGAVTVSPPRLRTLGKGRAGPLMLAPGATHVFRLDRLLSGFRGDDVRAYWTAPGAYKIFVEWRTAIAPARTTKPPEPPPYAHDEEAWQRTTLTSNTVIVTVKSP